MARRQVEAFERYHCWKEQLDTVSGNVQLFEKFEDEVLEAAELLVSLLQPKAASMVREYKDKYLRQEGLIFLVRILEEEWQQQDPDSCTDWYCDKLADDDGICAALLNDRSVESPHDVVKFIDQYFDRKWNGAPCLRCGKGVSVSSFVLVDGERPYHEDCSPNYSEEQRVHAELLSTSRHLRDDR